VSLDRAGPDASEGRGTLDRSTSGDEFDEGVDLALCCLRRERAAQIPLSHACRLAAASHSSQPSIGMV